MGIKGPEIHETQLLEGQDGSPEEQSRKFSLPFLPNRSRGSECSLDTVHKHGWKPLTLGAPALFSFAFASLLLAAIIEILAQQSQNQGGLALSDSADDIPAFANFCYLFLPTIVAVIYSLLYSWIDLDVKRMQPWLEMSKPEGATAERSVFLDYPYDFVAFVPLRAAKRRHWAVFYGGTVMVMIFWLITPLQSAIMGTGPVNVQQITRVSHPQTPLPASEQIMTMDQSILNEGYAITWLNQSYPEYTTAEYTLLPFTVDSNVKHVTSTNWTGPTTKYWTEIDCRPAEFGPRGPGYDFLDGRGCNASEIVPYGGVPSTGNIYKMHYIGYHNSPWADYWLSMTCSKAAQHEFLAIWARQRENETEQVTASFCETSYFKQQVNATVSSLTKRPIENSVVPIGPRELVSSTEFNSSAFEHLLGAGTSSVELEVSREYPFGRLLEQHFQVRKMHIRWPSSPLVGFAIGSQNVTTLEPFQDNAFMDAAYNKTHKMLFSIALRRMLANSSSEATATGTVDFVKHGIIVSRVFSAIVEGLLVVVGVFTMMLWWHSNRAQSRLTMDPASLGSLMSFCQNSSTLLDKFAGKGCLPDEKLREALEDKKFQLFCGCQSSSGQMVIKVVDTREEFYESQRISIQPDTAFSVGHYSPVKPLALRRSIGSAVILSMIGATVALVYLKWKEKQIGGLIRPTTNFELLQILENYIPTLFATFLEPFWVLVNRLLCIIQPFKDLWSGRRSARGSIDAKYTSLPPQLVVWRAARSGHFVLVAICLLALLSNLLAVGLGGIFNELPISVNRTSRFQQRIKTTFNNDTVNSFDSHSTFYGNVISYEMHFYIAMNNITQGTALPPWVSKDYFFQPFPIAPGEESRSDTYTARTRGFSTIPSCIDAGTTKSWGRAPVLNYTYKRGGETVPGCPTTYQPQKLDLNKTTSSGEISGPSSAETVGVLKDDHTPCGIPLILSWSRTSEVQNREDGEIDTWFAVCTPEFTTSMFDVTVDPVGHVLHAKQVSKPSFTPDLPIQKNTTDTVTTYVNDLIEGFAFPWHNNTLSKDWMNYLIKIQPGYADILDPLTIPNPKALIPVIERTYRQFYVIFLSLNLDFFDNYTQPVIITGTEHHIETRIFMDTAAFIISLSVLALNIVVAITLYGFTIKHFLPRMPTTIGSILAYLAPSRAVREYEWPDSAGSGDSKDGPRGRKNGRGSGTGGIDKQAPTFSFGRYVGDDGRAHVGIEVDPYVVPVKLSALRKGDTEPRTGLLRRILGRGKKERQGDTWL
ncbi:uncharacterized protein CLUP02_07930 [Colletotrichum lupini]|uniref:Uncharacterized protein n=1 Tax=Colletotrichum lupini TaxID=145971 RepID=A0A9Q8STS8_9PEZI|nr:uncharacterized protein CLUP02_07930 [Colletotrichum lupini]KAK1718589.1 hypothetical protein BDP67DRAFT_459890 [Colletotrichum lupini]UQC82442.1 hypothetical protein CLUP02_07930 [Colletotrichum lupini]